MSCRPIIIFDLNRKTNYLISKPHSEVPQNDDDWPTLESIVNFRDRVRARLTRLYDELTTGRRQVTRKIGRVLFITLEHEGFHAEVRYIS